MECVASDALPNGHCEVDEQANSRDPYTSILLILRDQVGCVMMVVMMARAMAMAVASVTSCLRTCHERSQMLLLLYV